MAIVLEKNVTPAAGRPGPAQVDGKDSRVEIVVIFTSVNSTLAALLHAGSLAHRLAGKVTLLVPQVVPFPLPLTSPPVLIDWNERRFRVIAESSPVDTKVRLYLCRDRDETLKQTLRLRSLVVLGTPKSWWPFTVEERLARKLRRWGHEVVLIEAE